MHPTTKVVLSDTGYIRNLCHPLQSIVSYPKCLRKQPDKNQPLTFIKAQSQQPKTQYYSRKLQQLNVQTPQLTKISKVRFA